MSVLYRQWSTERALKKRGVRFRATDPGDVEASYAAMSQDEFDAINGPQTWANWRTIPRALNGHIPERPLRVLDLPFETPSFPIALLWHRRFDHLPAHQWLRGLIISVAKRVRG